MKHGYTYQGALTAAQKVGWRVEDIIGGERRLDFTRPFLPEGLARVESLGFLTADERRVLNQVRGAGYLAIFGLVEEFILPFVLDHARPRLADDDHRTRALLQFAGEEAKHIHLFRRFRAEFEAGFGSRCDVIGPAATIAARVLAHEPLPVALLILHIEWLTQRHFLEARPLPAGYDVDLDGEGEWKITLQILRDLGAAFGAALALIYVLLVAQTSSLSMPLVIMVAIPLTVIGIMPGFYLLNALFTRPVGSYDDHIFFTATGMIGMIALAGIVVRNAIILIDFIERHRRAGRSTHDAIALACGVRLRPILLTASAAMLGSVVITLDPIFSGLAWSFIFGIFASTAFTLLVVPVLYDLTARELRE
jgi:hypothetical protein